MNLGSNHGFERCNPVLEMVNFGDLGEMGFGAGLEVCRAAVVEARVLEFIQCSNLSFCCGKAYLLFGFVIEPMSGFISGVPFILTFLPYQTDEIAGPSYAMICVGWFEGLGRNVLLLELLPLGGPPTKDELVPPNAGLAFYKGGEASWNYVEWDGDIFEPTVNTVEHEVRESWICLEKFTAFSQLGTKG
jgi:hypothetical protein